MDLTKMFWNHVATLQGEHNIDDVFLSWAAEKNLKLSVAQDTWKKVYAQVFEFFNPTKVATDIEVSPDGGVSIKNVGDGDSAAPSLDPPLPMGGPQPPVEPALPKPLMIPEAPAPENMGKPEIKEVAPPMSITAPQSGQPGNQTLTDLLST